MLNFVKNAFQSSKLPSLTAGQKTPRMLNFVKNAFQDFFVFLLWINLIGWTIVGGLYGISFVRLNGMELQGLLGGVTFIIGLFMGLIIGFLINIIGGGLIATILNIDKNLETIVATKQMERS